MRSTFSLSGLCVLALFAGVALAPNGWADTPKPGTEVQKTKPADPFGYTAAFDEEIKKLGQLSVDDFVKRYSPKGDYLPGLSWDPTTGKYWDRFAADPNKIQIPARKDFGGQHRFDFRLNADELAVFKKNGFVVSERMGDTNFSDLYYRIYSRDLPVFITADSVLHAWHKSFDTMLEEIEVSFFIPMLNDLLAGMASKVADAQKEAGAGVLADSIKDADYFVAVARSLLNGKQEPSVLDQDKRVAATLQKCADQQLEEIDFFGRKRRLDFSQFKVRGRYEKSEELRKYFRGMMWCGYIDMRVAGNPEEASPRELGAALVLLDLVKRAGCFTKWEQFDRILQTLIGRTDSMTFDQLNGLLEKGGVKTLSDVKNLAVLEKIQGDIVSGKLGMQHIKGHPYFSSPFGTEKYQVPHSFTFLGQKFTVDSWVTSKVVFDDVLWDGNKVMRRVPSCLDVAFAAFGNDHLVPDLAERFRNKGGRVFRDGLNYQHNLAAVRNVLDSQSPELWRETVYMHWLACLRELSKPTTDTKYPEAVRTRAWAMKSTNTQLASWTQLRHDTILYVKQSITGTTLCEYPAGYVEPIPHFWARVEEMATRSALLIEKTPMPKYWVERDVYNPQTQKFEKRKVEASGEAVAKQHVQFLRNFAKNVGMLKAIATKELAQEQLTAEETKFIEQTVEVGRGSGAPRYTGWYPGLFYNSRSSNYKADTIVADVHTNPKDENTGDPGCVLHQGVGMVDVLIVAIDNGKDRMVYAGPTLSHYEFEMPHAMRKTNSEWRKDLSDGKAPPRPAWTKSYLVPGKSEATKKLAQPEREE